MFGYIVIFLRGAQRRDARAGATAYIYIIFIIIYK